MITNKNELAAELARRCTDSENFEGDLNVTQAAHALKCLREIAADTVSEGAYNVSDLADMFIGCKIGCALIPTGQTVTLKIKADGEAKAGN